RYDGQRLSVEQQFVHRRGVVPAGTLMLKSAQVAPSAGPKVPLMGRVEQPNKSDCQDISLGSWEEQLPAPILVSCSVIPG
ncbi:hypothetical protein L195_g045915, partial [Trifolium pratense]